jgi:hypothetical protein
MRDTSRGWAPPGGLSTHFNGRLPMPRRSQAGWVTSAPPTRPRSALTAAGRACRGMLLSPRPPALVGAHPSPSIDWRRRAPQSRCRRPRAPVERQIGRLKADLRRPKHTPDLGGQGCAPRAPGLRGRWGGEAGRLILTLPAHCGSSQSEDLLGSGRSSIGIQRLRSERAP